ncbi:hypothetical protein NUW54_g7289 [Trametes sanguinea]|uniref:Uncharacterized protein n=1 Tax=Trametes sanguinea TaxID=158606 RepID=A0ACC1PPZ9_9APHY|nr:hypothetical protein NUW54_g7289 [Trametes sanguinea]
MPSTALHAETAAPSATSSPPGSSCLALSQPLTTIPSACTATSPAAHPVPIVPCLPDNNVASSSTAAPEAAITGPVSTRPVRVRRAPRRADEAVDDSESGRKPGKRRRFTTAATSAPSPSPAATSAPLPSPAAASAPSPSSAATSAPSPALPSPAATSTHSPAATYATPQSIPSPNAPLFAALVRRHRSPPAAPSQAPPG